MAAGVHPREALAADGERGHLSFPAIPVCEHYAGSEERIGKALALQAELAADHGALFDVSCDCEDGARPGAEKAHAEMVVRMVDGPANRHGRVGARIHDPAHPAFASDVEILAGARKLAYLVIPKVDSAAQASKAIDAIRRAVPREVPIHLLVETHGALADVEALAALPGVETLDFGLMDFVSAHQGAIPATALRSPGQFEHRLVIRAKARIAAAALAHGVVPSHNVTLDFRNPDTAYQDARRARLEYGYLRMWSIHPSQIRPIVDAMKPEHGEVQQAAAVLLAAQAAGWGPVQHAGEMHDKATYRLYWTLLQQAKMTGVPLPREAEQAFFSA